LCESCRLGPQNRLHEGKVHAHNVDALGGQHPEYQDDIAPQRHLQGGYRLGAAVEHMHILEQHHEKQQQVSGGGLVHRFHPNHPEPVPKREDAYGQSRDKGLPDHLRIKNGFVLSSRSALHGARLSAFKGQGHILNAVGDQIEPQQLHGQQRQGQPR